MYIKEIKISNFRNFKEASVPFHEGVNVIIGHNNTGKKQPAPCNGFSAWS